MNPIELFLLKVKITESCWLWLGSVSGNGYGDLWVGKKHMNAHRYSYTLHKGEIPDGMHILHSCDNRPCVNPDYLSIGTNSDNINDAIKKGRFRPLRKNKNGDSIGISSRHKSSLCFNGHDITKKENIYTSPNSRRFCKVCDKIRSKKYNDKK